MTLRKIEPPIEERIVLWKELIQNALDSHKEGSPSPLGDIELSGVTPEDWALMSIADQALVALIEEYEKLQKDAACTHERVLIVSGSCRDMCYIRWPDGCNQQDGYMVYNLGLGGGDDIWIKVCVDCQKVIGLASPEDIQKAQDEWAEENR